MARAKRTDRAEARRRYRAEVAELEAVEEGGDEDGESDPQDEAAGSAAGSTSRQRQPRPNQLAARSAAGSSAEPPRPGFVNALRSATRPWNLRSDIAYIPDLVLHTRAVWLPALATIGSGAYFLLSQPLGSNGIALFLFQLFVVPPTIAGAFLAGILAPRATYVAGGIAASIGVVVFAFVVLTIPDTSLVQQPSAPPGPPIDPVAAIIQSIFLSVPFGVLIGGAGGYYRRFLRLSSAGARQRDEQRARQARERARRR